MGVWPDDLCPDDEMSIVSLGVAELNNGVFCSGVWPDDLCPDDEMSIGVADVNSVFC